MIFSYMLIACVANYWLSIPAVVIIVSLTFLRYYFLHASRGVQRLEALGKVNLTLLHCTNLCFTARSPLYSHISATIQGLTTIRAYKEQTRFMNKLHFYSDEHSKAWYTKLSAAQWFGIRLDMIGVVFVTLVMFCSIPLADSEYSLSVCSMCIDILYTCYVCTMHVDMSVSYTLSRLAGNILYILPFIL